MTKVEAAQRLVTASGELRRAYHDLASEEIASLEAKFARWEMGSEGLGVTEFRMELDFSAYQPTIEVINIKGRIAQLEEETNNLRFLIKYGLEDVING